MRTWQKKKKSNLGARRDLGERAYDSLEEEYPEGLRESDLD